MLKIKDKLLPRNIIQILKMLERCQSSLVMQAGDTRYAATIPPRSKGKLLQDLIKHSYSKCRWGPFIFRAVRKQRAFAVVNRPLFTKSNDDLDGNKIGGREITGQWWRLAHAK